MDMFNPHWKYTFTPENYEINIYQKGRLYAYYKNYTPSNATEDIKRVFQYLIEKTNEIIQHNSFTDDEMRCLVSALSQCLATIAQS